MHLGRPAGNTAKQIVWGSVIVLFLLFIVAFLDKSLSFRVTLCFLSFLPICILWIILLAFQSLLPITNLFENPGRCLLEVYRTAWHLLLYMFHMHGPAIFVKDGIANSTPEDEKREKWPGVVVVDFNSAVVLEERNPPPGLELLFIRLIMFILENLRLCDRPDQPRSNGIGALPPNQGEQVPIPRVRGSGIVFTRPRERIRGTVDLRKHFRLQPKVTCYTRDGIELYANVLAIFTVGQEPDILQVHYVGAERAENLRVVSLSPIQGGAYQRVASFGSELELDDQDRDQIHGVAQRTLAAYRQGQTDVLSQYTDLPTTDRQVFDADRVFSAVFAQARNGNEEVLPWTELPTRVAAGFYREILARINYDELFDVREETGSFPLPGYKAGLRFAMRNNGILSYRLLFHNTFVPLNQGFVHRANELLVSPIHKLTAPKALRDRGIKVLLSSFGDPYPVNDAVYKQRLSSWKSSWESETEITLATRNMEALRIGGQAHAQAQRDLWYQLSQIFGENNCTDEVMAIRLLQSLENIVADPKTRKLLPGDIVAFMAKVHELLVPHNFFPPTSGQGVQPSPNPDPENSNE